MIKSVLATLSLTAAAIAGLPAAAHAQGGPPPTLHVDPLPASRRPSIELGTCASGEQWESFLNQTSVRNVTGAALYPVLPPKGRGNGKAVIVAPGGGYLFVSIESEGFRVAEALAAQGYAAFVLKYRTLPTPRDIPGYMAETAKVFGNLGKATLKDNPAAVDDLAAAIAYVRSHAGDWQVDPDRIGALGFSAGSRTLIRLLEGRPEAKLLENAALLYPPMTEVVAPGARPPLFLAIAGDDPLFRQGGLTLAAKWLADSPRLEFHLYAGGSHGFGMRPQGTTSDLWIDQYLAWLAKH